MKSGHYVFRLKTGKSCDVGWHNVHGSTFIAGTDGWYNETELLQYYDIVSGPLEDLPGWPHLHIRADAGWTEGSLEAMEQEILRQQRSVAALLKKHEALVADLREWYLEDDGGKDMSARKYYAVRIDALESILEKHGVIE